MNANIDLDELEQIDGGNSGTVCGLAIGATIALAFANPLTLFLTTQMAAAACMADYLA